ncbi:MAG: YeeE/YedE family protein [Betaproteobacteria bacterium]|nr:YeeE/YedE family protein [Betaproteobacteria bacterium]
MKTLAFLSGIVFGIGLLVSGMTDPAKVIAFLDIAGPWDPSLILVMVTAVVVALVPMQLAQRRARSLVGEKIAFPSTRGITGKLILGSAIFGIGWGMTGLCPGPSLASLAASTWQEWLFFSNMVAGMIGFELWQRMGQRTRSAPAVPLAAATSRKT